MRKTGQLSWRSALLTGWVVGLTASAIAQPPARDEHTRASLLTRLSSSTPSAVPALERRIAELEDRLAHAYFSEVAQAATALRPDLAASSPEARARLEMIAGTAHLALGAVSPAVACFKRAVEATPELELKPRVTSPKVLRAFQAARHQLESARLREATELAAAPDRSAQLIGGLAPIAPGEVGALRPTILCRILIDARGAVVAATVQRSRPDLARFEAVALDTVRSYRFEPAQRDGQPVSSWINWPVQF
jgi:TonB family protein